LVLLMGFCGTPGSRSRRLGSHYTWSRDVSGRPNLLVKRGGTFANVFWSVPKFDLLARRLAR